MILIRTNHSCLRVGCHSVNNYELTLVDLKNVGHQDDPWVLVNRVAQVFYVLNPETRKLIVVSGK
jgi:hypothetical protein